MNAPTDKDYIDSRLETISAQMLGEVRTIAVEMAVERKSYEAKMDGNIALIKEILERRLAQSTAETLRWTIGMMVAIAGLGLAYLTFLINNVMPKPLAAAAQPIVIYAQPAQAAPIPSLPAPASKP